MRILSVYEKAFKYYSTVDVFVFWFIFLCLEHQPAFIFFVLNPGLMFINISTKLYMARTDGLYIYLMTKKNMTVHQITQHDGKDVALIFKVKTGPHM